MQLQWIGGPTFVLRLGTFHLLSDPMFGEGPAAFVMHGHPSTGAERAEIARLAPLPLLDFAGLDLVLASHLHSDHFDAVATERLPHDVPVLAPAFQAQTLRQRGFSEVRGMEWWEEHTLERDGSLLRIIAVPARHAHSDALSEELGVVNGYVLEYSAGAVSYRIYWTGDTVWFAGMEEIRSRTGPINLLIPHLGAVGKDGPFGMMTLDAGEAVQVVNLFAPDVVIPIHHHTFSHYTEPVERFEQELGHSASPARLVLLAGGETMPLPPP